MLSTGELSSLSSRIKCLLLTMTPNRKGLKDITIIHPEINIQLRSNLSMSAEATDARKSTVSLLSTMDEETEEGGPPSKTTLSGEHGRHSRAKRRKKEKRAAVSGLCFSSATTATGRRYVVAMMDPSVSIEAGDKSFMVDMGGKA
ncbi:hypothetical protein N1851_021629 [Merluccius polli]|uniref:Uncharacterized protein n=1 Tax=Merluccius polli TaxID=89951 RepID=A0AA47NWJ8_MERPO|nr:hypothetical protein N1851_021629 [Merluccius polli]